MWLFLTSLLFTFANSPPPPYNHFFNWFQVMCKISQRVRASVQWMSCSHFHSVSFDVTNSRVRIRFCNYPCNSLVQFNTSCNIKTYVVSCRVCHHISSSHLDVGFVPVQLELVPVIWLAIKSFHSQCLLLTMVAKWQFGKKKEYSWLANHVAWSILSITCQFRSWNITSRCLFHFLLPS